MATSPQFILWALRNLDRLKSGEVDPIVYLHEMWIAVRWPLFGIAVFLLALVWALVNSVSVLIRSGKVESGVPPKIV